VAADQGKDLCSALSPYRFHIQICSSRSNNNIATTQTTRSQKNRVKGTSSSEKLQFQSEDNSEHSRQSKEEAPPIEQEDRASSSSHPLTSPNSATARGPVHCFNDHGGNIAKNNSYNNYDGERGSFNLDLSFHLKTKKENSRLEPSDTLRWCPITFYLMKVLRLWEDELTATCTAHIKNDCCNNSH
jgi:hypothetical protein